MGSLRDGGGERDQFRMTRIPMYQVGTIFRCQNVVDLRMSHAVSRLACPAAAFYILENRVSVEEMCCGQKS
uniref:Uncharacterized protein n=1 Tax=Angiostrongylus cantonensis TaxID=6313 RepID=A0A0K0DLD0_ANGCA